MISIDFSVYRNLNDLPEVTSHQTVVSSRQEKYHPEGLYSEQIFGPEHSYRCQCGSLFGKINSGKRCPNCGVLCASSEIRSQTFAKIVLPEEIYVINPDFIGTISNIFGSHAIKNILNKKNFTENKDNPYFYSFEKQKLLKENKIKKEERILEFPVYDINTLRKLFEKLKEDEETLKYFKSNTFHEEILNYFFLNAIPVLPPTSRPLIKLNNKIYLHEISSIYNKIITSKKNISDSFFQENSDMFGYAVYKYQEKMNELYEKILENNFQKKESYIRESLTGKTIEFSQRSVVIPNPALKPYEIGLHKESVQKLFLPELLRYFYEKYETETIEEFGVDVIKFFQKCYNMVDYNDQIKISDKEFVEFLQRYAKEFRVLIEREPVLWMYNLSGVLVGKVFGDNDMFK